MTTIMLTSYIIASKELDKIYWKSRKFMNGNFLNNKQNFDVSYIDNLISAVLVPFFILHVMTTFYYYIF